MPQGLTLAHATEVIDKAIARLIDKIDKQKYLVGILSSSILITTLFNSCFRRASRSIMRKSSKATKLPKKQKKEEASFARVFAKVLLLLHI